MTEYDYSEEAYEKYLATQQRIARWVDETHRCKLVGPDVPPTPLVDDTNVPLPHHRERRYRPSEPSKSSKHYHLTPSPPPERVEQSARKNRSMSMSAPATHLPAPFIPTAEVPAPGCPVYHLPFTSNPPKLAEQPAIGGRTSLSTPSRSKTWDYVSSKQVPQIDHAAVYPPSDSGSSSPELLNYSPIRKRSTSFSAAVTRPAPTRSQTAPQQYNIFYPEPVSREQSSYYSSQNSSPNYPYPSSMGYLPQSSTPAPAASYPAQSFVYPFPYQQYPDYDAVRRQEPLRANTAPAHAPRYSMDSNPYPYSAPRYSYHSDKPSIAAYQPPPQPQSAQVLLAFPNGKQMYVTPSQSTKLDYSKVRLRSQLLVVAANN